MLTGGGFEIIFWKSNDLSDGRKASSLVLSNPISFSSRDQQGFKPSIHSQDFGQLRDN
jgi:hypothetical protein